MEEEQRERIVRQEVRHLKEKNRTAEDTLEMLNQQLNKMRHNAGAMGLEIRQTEHEHEEVQQQIQVNTTQLRLLERQTASGMDNSKSSAANARFAKQELQRFDVESRHRLVEAECAGRIATEVLGEELQAELQQRYS